jgi:23S rRNA pseudouridine1911/1915/1917 synthase
MLINSKLPHTMDKQDLVVEITDSGKRLDLYLALKLPQLSRSQLKNLINHEQVTVNGNLEFHPQYRVKQDDKISVITNQLQSEYKQSIKSIDIGLDIVYEDSEILALNKPADMVVHPGTGHWDDTLANGVKFYLESKKEFQWSDTRVGQIHRIDGPTSGLIIYAKTPQALWLWSQRFAQRQVNKYYLAVVKGIPQSRFRISNRIGRDKYDENKVSSNSQIGRLAETEFTLLASSDKYSLLQVEPHTGRTHQIRVHLSEAGFPIVGDTKYNGQPFSRLMLHAWQIRTDDIKLLASPGSDFIAALARLGIDSKKALH